MTHAQENGVTRNPALGFQKATKPAPGISKLRFFCQQASENGEILVDYARKRHNFDGNFLAQR